MRYVRCHIFCLLGTTLFMDKLTAYAHSKYLPLLQNFYQIGSYSWGSVCLTHLYRSLCRASRYDCKEMDSPLDLFVCRVMDSPLDLLFAWVWERMPWLAPIPRHRLVPAEIPVALRLLGTQLTLWRSIINNLMLLESFCSLSYVDIIILADLYTHLNVCDTVGPLVSFECVEWLPADRVVCQYGYAQSPLWQYKPYQLTRTALLFGEYSTMTSTGFMTNGYNNGVTTATVICEIGVYDQFSTSPRLPITGVCTVDHTKCT
ncbi:hypothetical protein Ahy_A02g007330 [Arachis hypogaea]|uniref:Aminotransferase-like plant mobile domain-containing protein n=1 Tax=Arachis hypogaea TaxID=3818 RepID=A0A445EC43_ARAHY|nr:hypothetical protein Ahy_A02g007330 [Arachis hypogaea]